jgi:superfamily II DNA or RNA helicase
MTHRMRDELDVGALVRARGVSWRVEAIERYRVCQIVTLTPAGHLRGVRSSVALMTPFDRITPISCSTKWHVCGVARAVARVASAIRDVTAGGIAGMLAPDLALVPWQWAAATLVRRGAASAVLIADAVGLGKTIQAALVVAALRARGDGQRVLILVPAGLRDQWRAELERLFGFECSVLDAGAVHTARRAMPADVNPWTVTSTAIASIDYVKQPEVLAAAAGVAWDVLVVDEAHALRSGTDRREAAAALAGCARHVLLLSATPHAGSADEFGALCGVGEIDGDDARTLVIRRTRNDVGLQTSRRVHIARVAPNTAERLMHARLEEYASTVWRERGARSAAACLAMTVLLKRAASSAWALRRSIDHRLALLGGGEVPPAQAVLPFGDPGETDAADAEVPAALAEPGLDERARELQWLARLAEMADAAAVCETKLSRIERLLRRVGEPAIVFTEYRDTLDAALRGLGALGPIAVLHGGLPRAERREAERAFTAGNARVLLATDAASEGLNLHVRCRLVVNIELPWNPVRLEQRIGRIDRIGQRRRVHAVHLVGRDTAEQSVLRRLVGRARSIREALGGDDPIGIADVDLAAGALHLATPEAPASALAPPSVSLWSPVDGGERALCELLERARNLIRPRRARTSALRASPRLPVGVVGPRLRRRLSLEPGVVLVCRVDAIAATGRPAASAVVVVHVALAAAACRARPTVLVSAVLPMARAAAIDDGMYRLAADLDAYRRYIARATTRETALLETAAGDGTRAAVQAGLFDRRAVNDAARQEKQRERRCRAHATRLEQLALDARVDPVARADPLVALVLR